jgi:uncharacterized protein (DUF362 family)
MNAALPREKVVSVSQAPAAYDDKASIQGALGRALGLSDATELVVPGDRVVIKPNWIKEHDERRPGPGSWEHVITHPAVIEAVARWAAERLRGAGSITICDAPQTDSSFRKIQEYCGTALMLDVCRRDLPGVDFSLLDLRSEEWRSIDGVAVGRTALPGDPQGTTAVALNQESEFFGRASRGRLYGASFDVAETNSHHADCRHEYLLCRTPLEADVFINVPKLKTHKKVGLTCALKNLVGINANKNWLPHYTLGAPSQGGDQFPCGTLKARLEQSLMGFAKRLFKRQSHGARMVVPFKKAGRWVFGDTARTVRSGNWHGNDTCWRMVLDLNKCLLFFDGLGMRRKRPLRYLAVVDGIIAGEGDGPSSPDPKPCGLLMAGVNPVAVDCAAAMLMGFDWRRLLMLKGAFATRGLPLTTFEADEIQLVSDREGLSGALADIASPFRFRPHFGWVGAVERGNPDA